MLFSCLEEVFWHPKIREVSEGVHTGGPGKMPWGAPRSFPSPCWWQQAVWAVLGSGGARHKAQDPATRRGRGGKEFPIPFISCLKGIKELSWNLVLTSPKRKEEEWH